VKGKRKDVCPNGGDVCILGGGSNGILAWRTGHILNLDMRGIELGLQGRGDGFGCYTGRVCFGGCLGVGGRGHGSVRMGSGVETGAPDRGSVRFGYYDEGAE
jgi:hypothetical protein